MSTDSVYFRESIHAFKKHRSFVWIYSQLQIHTMLYVLLFGFIMMFDTSMFLLSFDTDWAQTTLVENTGLNAVYILGARSY